VSTGIRLTLKIIVLWCLGTLGFHQLTAWAAPGHPQAAVLVGVLLTSFGVVAASQVMQLLVLPLAVLRMLRRVVQGRKPMVINADGRDPLDGFARAVFVAGFALLSMLVGACAGLATGGSGFFASAAAFAAGGVLFALLVPLDVVFATDADTGGTVTEAQRADHAAARQAGEPTVLLADRVVKGLREKLFEDARRESGAENESD
jgi:hypothetical protein